MEYAAVVIYTKEQKIYHALTLYTPNAPAQSSKAQEHKSP